MNVLSIFIGIVIGLSCYLMISGVFFKLSRDEELRKSSKKIATLEASLINKDFYINEVKAELMELQDQIRLLRSEIKSKKENKKGGLKYGR